MTCPAIVVVTLLCFQPVRVTDGGFRVLLVR